MAGKDIVLKIQSELTTTKQDIGKLKETEAFTGKSGARSLNKIEGLFDALSKVDVSKLSGPALTKFLNELLQLRQYLDSAAKSITNFSEDYKKALSVEEKALQAQTKAADKYAEVLTKQKEVQSKLNLGYEGTTYKNAKGRTISNPDTIAEEYRAGSLRVFNKNGTELNGAARDRRLESAGIPGYAQATLEANNFKKELEAATEALKKAKEVLENTPTGNTVHPTTSEVLGHSQGTAEVVGGIKENINTETEKSIQDTSVRLSDFNNNLNKQSSSLGRVFKQFTLYAVALRTAKKALREATATIKEVDRALTEQAMVTGITRKQAYNLLTTYQNMASRLGSTTKEVSSTMTQFLRQGRSIEEATKLTEAAVSAAKIAGISASESINYLTTAVNGFRLSADDAMKVSDKFAAVAATAAVSYDEIAIALSKVAAQANLAGMSIDYTTALLTKGIETTREAPETIGTALKTVIARMREMTDYGETLEGDTNINNVESQLAYIGIALRDNNGELRSTEDVLNDLGKQWDDLNANQQAAIAKALAGTRQQSRLIAMMQDYERVIELQEIAEQSQGATMAQMATYMEGMDAALNKVSVAWEKIVSSIANSEVIIGLINGVANVMDDLGSLLENDFLLVTSLVTIGGLLLISATRRYEVQKAQNRAVLEENKEKQKQRFLALQNRKEALEAAKAAIAEAKTEEGKTKELAKQALLNKDMADDALAVKILSDQNVSLKEAEKYIDAELLSVNKEIGATKLEMLNTDIAISENAAGIGEIWGHIASVMQPVISILTIINTLQQAYAAAQLKSAAAAAKQTGAEVKKSTVQATGMFAGIVNAFSEGGIPGVIAGIAIATALVAALGVGIAVAVSAAGGFKKQNGSKQINDLSKSIYDLNKKATELDTTISKFDELDNKIIKTNKDLEEMHSLLDSASDSLTDEQKEAYDALQTDVERRNYLAKVIKETNDSLDAARNKQRNIITKMRDRGGSSWNNWLTSTKTEDIQARDAMYALNNATMYQQVAALQNISDEARTSVRKLTQSILEGLSAADAASLLDDAGRIQKYVDTISANSNLAEILQSEDYTISERVEAYEKLREAIIMTGDQEVINAFDNVNTQWQNFTTQFKDTLDYIDNIGASIDDINNMSSAIQKLGYDSNTSARLLNDMFAQLEQGADLSETLTDMFGDNARDILNAYDKAFGTTVLNMGQNVDKFTNSIDSFYTKAGEWATMSETDKTAFLSENADLFKGASGQALLKAFESGNYALIAQALGANEALAKQRESLIKDVDRQIAIEMARSADEQDAAYIKLLQDYKRQLEDTNTLFLASLKTRYEQQQNQLDLYKDLLQKETDALTEALDKRKEAYQKYFDAINQEAEDEEYEEQAQTLIANISKLSSSTNADAMAKTADLTKQLEELEKERLQTLRERAQEAVIQNIEDEVTKINDNLEKLLNNEQALLNAMINDTGNSSQFIASMLSAQAMNGNNTELGMQSYLQQMQSTFAAIMPGVDWNEVDVERRGDNLILNIMGKEVVLTDGEQQTIYDAIQSALRQIGYN